MARRALCVSLVAVMALSCFCVAADDTTAAKTGKEGKGMDEKTAESAVELALRAALSVSKKPAARSRQEREAEALVDRVGGGNDKSKDEAVKLLANALSKVEADSGVPVLDLSETPENSERHVPAVQENESSMERMVSEVANLAKEALKSRQERFGPYGPHGAYPPYMYPQPAQAPQVIPIPYPMQIQAPNGMGAEYLHMGGPQYVNQPLVEQSYLRGMEGKIESDMAERLVEKRQSPKKMTWEDLDKEEYQGSRRVENDDASFVPISFRDKPKETDLKKAMPSAPKDVREPERDSAVDTDGDTAEEQVESLLGSSAD